MSRCTHQTCINAQITSYLEGTRRLLLSHVAVLVQPVLGLPVLLQLHAEVHVLEHDGLVRGLPCLVAPA